MTFPISAPKRLQHTLLLILTGVAIVGNAAHAQQQAPIGSSSADVITCKDIVIPVRGAPFGTNIIITIAPKDLINQCSAPAGATLSLVSPAKGVTLAASTDWPQTITYTVTDNAGHKASAEVIVSRK